jgi:hypothetical protein
MKFVPFPLLSFWSTAENIPFLRPTDILLMNRTWKFWSLIGQHLCRGIWKLFGSLQHMLEDNIILPSVQSSNGPLIWHSQFPSYPKLGILPPPHPLWIWIKRISHLFHHPSPWTLLTLFFDEHDDRVLERIQSQPEGETHCHQSSYDRNIVSITEIYKNCYGKLHLGYYISDVP